MSPLRNFFAVVILFLIPSLRAQVLYGPEWTMSHASLLQEKTPPRATVTELSRDFQEKYVNQIMATCPSCQIDIERKSLLKKDIKIKTPEGFTFTVTTDRSVIEVLAEPHSARYFKQKATLIQKLVFETAGKIGLVPHAYRGGGHIHMDYNSSTHNELLLVRNILVDWVNHSYLFGNILSLPNANAPSLSSLPKENQQAFLQLIKEVDQGKIKSAFEFLQQLQEKVYTFHKLGWIPASKYQMYNVNKVLEHIHDISKQTFEFRGFNPQQNAEQFALQLSLLDGRTAFLQRQRKPIALALPPLALDPHGALESFAKFAAESGLTWEEAKDLVNWRALDIKQENPRHFFPVIRYCPRVL